ncbi:hypothetical protein A2U01_0018603, partial [Trifolium medium]|nr:hypothetical protein [Trifolium medium]
IDRRISEQSSHESHYSLPHAHLSSMDSKAHSLFFIINQLQFQVEMKSIFMFTQINYGMVMDNVLA